MFSFEHSGLLRRNNIAIGRTSQTEDPPGFCRSRFDGKRKGAVLDVSIAISLQCKKARLKTAPRVTATAILALLKELEFSCEPAFTAMLRSPWKENPIVSSESQYIVDLTDAINRVSDIVKTEVEHRKYYRSFCDKAVG